MSFRRRLFEIRRLLRRKCCFLLFIMSVCGVMCFLGFKSMNSEQISDSEIHLAKRDVINAEGDKDALRPVEGIEQKYSGLTEFKADIIGNFEPAQKESKEGPGENGKALNIEGNQEEVRKANQEFGFNTFVSDKISLNRTIPDTRPSECKYWHYPSKLPKTTVCIVFHNEGWTPLLRTVHSVLNRSPPEVLLEVLMVDDFSDKEHLKGRLDKYVAEFNGRVRLLRNQQREGLIRSRSIGGENAKGEVVIFLDAHCEANTNWLPPLLAPIVEDSRTVTIPVIDSIDMNTWAYHPQYGYRGDELFRGIFEWGLLYKESELPPEEKKDRKHMSEPFRSPTHAGGLFAINRAWFEKLGWYDPGLQIWGGENFELSFKVWQCGGRVLNVPCSRVGHVYRNHMPYNFGKLSGPVISTNYKRVAEVWMDEYKEFYYTREPFMRYREAGDLTKQKELREKNNCKSFDWFMKNVAYDMPKLYPLLPPNVVWGEAKNEESGKCMDTMGQPIPGTLGVSGCHHYGGNQMFRLNQKGQMTTGEWCVIAAGSRVQTNRCSMGSAQGDWEFKNETKQIYNKDKDKCLNVEGDILNFANCDKDNKFQKWLWTELRI